MRLALERDERARALSAAVLLPILLALAAGCGQVNRSTTLGSYATSRTAPGATVAAALEQQLARQGLPAATVVCVHRMIVDVGATMACALRGAGTRDAVVFRFRTASGAIDIASIKAS